MAIGIESSPTIRDSPPSAVGKWASFSSLTVRSLSGSLTVVSTGWSTAKS